MKRLPRNPHPLSLEIILALGHPVTPGPPPAILQLSEANIWISVSLESTHQKNLLSSSLLLILPAWNLPPHYPLVDSGSPLGQAVPSTSSAQ